MLSDPGDRYLFELSDIKATVGVHVVLLLIASLKLVFRVSGLYNIFLFLTWHLYHSSHFPLSTM